MYAYIENSVHCHLKFSKIHELLRHFFTNSLQFSKICTQKVNGHYVRYLAGTYSVYDLDSAKYRPIFIKWEQWSVADSDLE